MKVDPDDRNALMRLRFDMFDADDVGGERSLEVRDDATFHLFRRETVVLPDDAHDREVDIGKNVHWHRRDGRSTKNGDEQRHDDERVWATKREPDDPHDLACCPSGPPLHVPQQTISYCNPGCSSPV